MTRSTPPISYIYFISFKDGRTLDVRYTPVFPRLFVIHIFNISYNLPLLPHGLLYRPLMKLPSSLSALFRVYVRRLSSTRSISHVVHVFGTPVLYRPYQFLVVPPEPISAHLLCPSVLYIPKLKPEMSLYSAETFKTRLLTVLKSEIVLVRPTVQLLSTTHLRLTRQSLNNVITSVIKSVFYRHRT